MVLADRLSIESVSLLFSVFLFVFGLRVEFTNENSREFSVHGISISLLCVCVCVCVSVYVCDYVRAYVCECVRMCVRNDRSSHGNLRSFISPSPGYYQ